MNSNVRSWSSRHFSGKTHQTFHRKAYSACPACLGVYFGTSNSPHSLNKCLGFSPGAQGPASLSPTIVLWPCSCSVWSLDQAHLRFSDCVLWLYLPLSCLNSGMAQVAHGRTPLLAWPRSQASLSCTLFLCMVLTRYAPQVSWLDHP